MRSPTPPPQPPFFIDRSLGRNKLPAILRQAGIDLRTLAEVYGIPDDESIQDIEWLELTGSQGWPVLMKDARIRYRPAERAALVRHRVQAFCLTRANLTSPQMALEFLACMKAITDICTRESPCLYLVGGGLLRRIDLS